VCALNRIGGTYVNSYLSPVAQPVGRGPLQVRAIVSSVPLSFGFFSFFHVLVLCLKIMFWVFSSFFFRFLNDFVPAFHFPVLVPF
jgi:hypothetical protein